MAAVTVARMVVRIPSHALTLGKDPVFRGEWRGSDVIYAREDFSSGQIMPGLVTWEMGPRPELGFSVLQTPDTVTLASPNNAPQGVPGYRLLRVYHTDATGGVVYRAHINLAAFNLPEDLTVTRLAFHIAHSTTTNTSGQARFRAYVDGAEVGRPTGSSPNWVAPVSYRAASLTPESVIQLQLGANGQSSAELSWYISDIRVYGTLAPAYRFGDAVSWGGKVWQSTINNNNDEPGQTSRWIDLTPFEASAVREIVAGENIVVDRTDPKAPVVSARSDVAYPFTRTYATAQLDGVFGWLGTKGGREFYRPPVAVATAGAMPDPLAPTMLTVSQSSNQDAVRTADKAMDHALMELACETHTLDETDAWWQVDFGSNRRIALTRLAIVGRAHSGAWNGGGYHPRNFKIQTSLEGATWTDVASVTGAGPNDGTWWVSGVLAGSPARFVRILQTGPNANGSYHLVMGEVEMWGTVSRP